MVLRRCGVWLHDFFCDAFVFISVTRFGALVLFLMVALVVRVALRLSGVLLRVALKHRGSVAAGLGCGLWPADSVDCGDCGLAGSAVRGQGGGGSPLALLPRRPLPHGAEKLPAQPQLPLTAARHGSPI
jgi:hypothetical protein